MDSIISFLSTTTPLSYSPDLPFVSMSIVNTVPNPTQVLSFFFFFLNYHHKGQVTPQGQAWKAGVSHGKAKACSCKQKALVCLGMPTYSLINKPQSWIWSCFTLNYIENGLKLTSFDEIMKTNLLRTWTVKATWPLPSHILPSK